MNDDSATQRSVPDDQPTVRGLAAGQKVFGRFVLEVLLGRGGMGVVWRANDESLGETVALKFLPEVVARDAVAVDELKAETRRTRRLAHPHIVRVHDFMQDAQHAAVSMELVDGSTLAQMRLTQPGRVFAPETLAPMVAQLCEALDYAHHTAKVVHRDLKPANILVTRDGVAKISDFGIARNLSETHTRLTGTVGQTSGTLLYMSPQQLLGKKTTPADDIYALGATLYELITGKPPFYTGDITHQVLNVTPEGLAAQRIELGLKAGPIPRQWEETILACLAKDPAQRPSSAGEVALRLGLMGGGPARASGMKTDASAADQTELDVSAAAALTKVAAGGPPSPPADRGARRAPASAEAATLPRKFPWPLVAAGLFALLVIGGAAFYFKVYSPEQSRQAAIKLLVEEEDRNAIAARIDRLEPGASTAQRDATEAAVHTYLAAAPAKYTAEIQQRWTQRLADWDAPRRRAEEEKVAQLAAQKAEEETRNFDAMAAKVDALKDGAPTAQRDATEAEVKAYLAVAPVKEAAKIQSRWNQRLAGWQDARLAAATGGAVIRTSPAGADVVVGSLRRASSPLTLKDLKIGKYPVHITLDGYEDYVGELEVTENKVADPGTIALVRSTGTLAVTSTPAGLAYEIVGGTTNQQGQTPARIEKLPTGRYRVTVRNKDWKDPVEKTIEVKRGEIASVAAAVAMGTVQVDSQPAGASIWRDGRELVGTTPWHGDVLPADYSYELRLPGYRATRVAGSVESGKSVRLSATLKTEAGTIRPRVLVHGQPADLSGLRYFVDGREVKLANGQLDGVAPGERQVEAWHADYSSPSIKVTVADLKTSPVDLALVPKPAVLTLAVNGPADFTVQINGQPAVVTDHQVKVPAGEEVAVVVGAPGYKPATRNLTLPANGAQTLVVTLESIESAPPVSAKVVAAPAVTVPETTSARPAVSPSPAGPPPPYGRTHVIADLNLQLAPVGAGTFTMGSPFNEPGRAANEGPQTGVILTRPFWLGKYEVTQQQWQAVMGSNPSHYKKAGMNAPVEEISWDEAMEFCRKLTERERAAGRLPAGCIFTLPTEAQWEYACRAGTKGAVAGNLDNMTWYDKNSRGNEHAIDDKIPVFAALGAGDSGPARWIPKLQERDANPWGFYDMHGNVAEWCLDWYGDYPGGSLSDPVGPAVGTGRVYRGGGWNSPEPGVRSATRYAADPGHRDSFIGFRLALVTLPGAGTASNP